MRKKNVTLKKVRVMEYMSGSGGTDLAAAYGVPDTMASGATGLQNFGGEQEVRSVEYSSEIPEEKPSVYGSRPSIVNQTTNAQPKPSEPMYNQSELLQDINQKALKEQMQMLKEEIDQQKVANRLQYKENYERNSIYDKYSKRVKDVFRFLSLSFIIMFALGMHDVLSNSLNDYVDSIDVTPNRAIGMRLAYPVIVLLLYWSFKAYKF